MICQETANYKEERIVMRNLIYIICVILYTILLLDFVTLSHVQFLEFEFDFNIIYSIHLHITFAYLFSTLFIIYTFIAFIIFTFIVFAVYIFIIQLYICQCSCYSYLISSSFFVELYLIFCIQLLYLIFVVIIHEIFHYICTVLII